MNAPTIVCVLRSGGDFEPRHVKWLSRQIPGLLCLSDQKVDGVKTLPLQTSWPGWWAKMEAFGPAIDGDMLLIDLDTVVLRMPEMPTVTTVLRDFTRPDGIGSGFMFVTAADRERVWQAFNQDPKGHIARNQGVGDQGFLFEHLASAERWGGNVLSYKEHCRKSLPDGTDIVCFHGKPRPWEAIADWIPLLSSGDFREKILSHKGKRFCVMGGSPSLAEDLKQIEADIYISANGHGADLVDPQYLIAMDERHRVLGPMGDVLRKISTAPIISPHSYADIRLSAWPQHPRWVMTGLIGIWAAFVMGAKSIAIAGIDAYGGERGHVDEARKIARDVHCPVRVVSGPLQNVWPQYDPKEKHGKYQPHTAIDSWLDKDGLIQVKVLKPCTLNGLPAAKGEIHPAWRHDVWRLLKHRMIQEV